MMSVAAQLSRTADCFSRARFRGYTDFVDASLALSRLIVRENLEIYSVPFFSFLCTTPEMTLVQFRIKYLAAKFLIQIFNSFTSQQLGEILDSSNK